MTIEKTYTVEIKAGQEGSYIPFEFAIEENIECLQITYDYDKTILVEEDQGTGVETHAIIDFSIIGPNDQFLGSSGSNRSTLFFSQRESSLGFAKANQMQGTWTLLIGAYKVPQDGITVTYHLHALLKSRRLFKGDTHVHSTASDGQLNVETLIRLAEEMELDYIFLTDHNNYHPEAQYLSNGQLTVMPGVEWTQYQGHANFLGLAYPIDTSFVTTDEVSLVNMISQGRESGALFSLNHPFCPHVPWLWTKNIPLDAIEVYNGGTAPSANIQAIEWWHQQLITGNKITAIGGSDFHRFSQMNALGSPTTHVYAESNCQPDILAGIKKGDCFITNSPNGPGVDLISDSGKHMGDFIQSGEKLYIHFTNLKQNYLIKIISDCDIVEHGVSQNMLEYSLEILTDDLKFVRVEIWDTNYKAYINHDHGLLVLVSNPIYIK